MDKELRYIDLFAGCGGLSLGLYEAGWRGVFAIERNPSAFLTLKENLIKTRQHFDWPRWLGQRHWDIEDFLRRKRRNLVRLRGKIDLVVGGPPCQGFSTAGHRREGDTRNLLVHAYLRFVGTVRPRAIMFENVRGFTMKFKARAEKGLDYSEVVLRRLRSLGYADAQGRIIDMAGYGVPQSRRRFIVIATLNGSAGAIFDKIDEIRGEFLAARGLRRRNTVRAALSDLEKGNGTIPCPDSADFSSGIAPAPRTNFQRLLRRFRIMRCSPDSHRFVNHTPGIEGIFRHLLASAPRNCSLGTDKLKAYGLKKRNVLVLDPDEPAPTVTTIPDDFIHYKEPRVMTVRECARLQTFPDWFEFKGPYTTGSKKRVVRVPRYSQVGNAVPPLFAELVGIALKESLLNA